MLLGSMALGLAACSPTPTNYRLQAEPGPVLSQAALAVSVRSVSVPGYLDGTGIGKLSSAYQFATYPNDVWAEPLADMLQSAMVQDLAQRLPGATVLPDGGAIGAPTGIVVEMNVLRFDTDPDGQINLTVQISVRQGQNARHWQTTSFTRRAPPQTNTPLGIAATMSALWSQAANQVATMLVGPGG
jgi:uncharacterized lipoprotein YmbA